MRMRLVPLVVALALVATAAVAENPDGAKEKPKPLDGKDLYKNDCRVCHGAKATAGEYTPMSLIQEQWEEFFKGTYGEVHAKVPALSDPKKMVTDTIDAPALEAIRKFCVDHAADSEQPMTCG